MAEVYVVEVDNETPVEITGGRVGNFYIPYQDGFTTMFIGDGELSISEVGDPEPYALECLNGVNLPSSSFPYYFYVTSPDEIYAISTNFNGGSTKTYNLTIFHNR